MVNMVDIWLSRAMPSKWVLNSKGNFSFIKSEKIGGQNKCIVSCDGGASKEGHPHTGLRVR